MTFAPRNAFTVICLLLALAMPWRTGAQVYPDGNGISLSGIDQLDLYVNTSGLVEIPGDPSGFRLKTQQLLESRLASAGISRRQANRNHLVCSVQSIPAGEGLAYTTTVEYWLRSSTDVHTLMWRRGGLATINQGRLDAESIAAECADYFIGEWSRWNRS